MSEAKLLDECFCEALPRNPVASSSSVAEHVADIQDLLKNEIVTFGCSLCLEEFYDEHEYNRHMCMHPRGDGDGDGEWAASPGREPCAAARFGGDSAHLPQREHAVQKLCDDSHLADLARSAVAPSPASLGTYKIKAEEVDQSSESNIKTDPATNAFKSRKSVSSCAGRNDTYSCEHCDYNSILKSNLVSHMRTHTGGKAYTCRICDLKCTRRTWLIRHMKTHTEEKPYSCKYCEYKCVRYSVLVVHTRRHIGEKPYSCKLCMHKCYRNSELVVHMKTHTGEKPYSCELCDYKCSEKAWFNRHMRTHTRENSFACMFCDYKSLRRNDLRAHIRRHTGEKPYTCMFCDYRCVRNSTLKVHLRRHTGLITSELDVPQS